MQDYKIYKLTLFHFQEFDRVAIYPLTLDLIRSNKFYIVHIIQKKKCSQQPDYDFHLLNNSMIKSKNYNFPYHVACWGFLCLT